MLRSTSSILVVRLLTDGVDMAAAVFPVMRITPILLCLLVLPQPGTAGQHCGHEMHAAANKAMGFDQTRAFHHFHLRPDGGVIEIHANDPSDDETIRKIAAHLEQISRTFAGGDFTSSKATHGEVPPGVPTLQRMKERVRYRFAASPVGGRMEIAADDAEAIGAIHEFLRYQIREHRTGDPLESGRG